jgi:hypothetical protein
VDGEKAFGVGQPAGSRPDDDDAEQQGGQHGDEREANGHADILQRR